MENRNLDKALDIVSLLLAGEEISELGSNAALYQEYNNNGEVYDIVNMSFKKLNINVYEYKNAIYISAGENNRAFGYSNEELRRQIGVRNNKELYLAYFVIYNVMTFFRSSSDSSLYSDFVRIEEIIKNVDASSSGIIDKKLGIIPGELEEEGFKQIALSWDELPVAAAEDASGSRAARNSRSGFVKLVMNFLVSQELLVQSGDRYYPCDRFKALAESYFEEHQGRLFEIMKETGRGMEVENAAD